ncbi:hypothetical protein BCR43DRAFT_486816 [Syncephalastrum racemosum]|uniref:Uncharacterized protein n=1 Tax=Syncephalastrum racemosum TaxID=13706 RepID=A0A1X2HPQ2_SYNRA|nr:hypothetical protein BCR43DRAFT_486816 [Syncephalastrum racemosum]
MAETILCAKIISNLVAISMAAFLCVKTVLQSRRRRRGQQRRKIKDCLEFPGTLLFIAGCLVMAIHTLLLRRTYYNHWLSDKAYKCIECSEPVKVLDSFFEAISWIIALYVLWRVAKQQGGWRGTISRVLIYGGYLCAVIIVLCTVFNAIHTPKELVPFSLHKTGGPQQNHTVSAIEPIASPAITELASTDPVAGSNTSEAESNILGMMEQEEAKEAGVEQYVEIVPQPDPLESLPSSDGNKTATSSRLADSIDIPAVISWILHTAAQWWMAGLLPLLTYIQRQQIPSIGTFAAYSILMTIMPVIDVVCGFLVFLHIIVGFALYGDHSLGPGKDDATMEYLNNQAETWSTLTLLLLQHMLTIGLYLAAWFGHKWEAPHLRQHLHDDRDVIYQFNPYPRDAKQPLLALDEKPGYNQQLSHDYVTAVDADLVRRSV